MISLSDLVAFGVLPVCVGMALYKRDMFDIEALSHHKSVLACVPLAVIIAVSAIFVLAALVRLAYFNITVEETQGEGLGDKKHYIWLACYIHSTYFPYIFTGKTYSLS